MNQLVGTVFVVDDDSSIRKALIRLCRSAGLLVETFASAQEFLAHTAPEGPACLVLDIRLPGLNGLDLQTQMAARNLQTPIVFITGHGDIPLSVRAMKAGAVDFLAKPFHNADLLGAIRTALGKDARLKATQSQQETIQIRLQTLTPRERQVFEMVIKGMLNKQIAAELGASEQTIKVHRGRVMEKMQMVSVAELVQAAVMVGALKTDCAMNRSDIRSDTTLN
jgi:FixJ family two-component response regulator